ncbi:hypothetical protein O181_111859 [Austropuccinia psidii MF-1]|uniref:Uncharacterized protein n=1 Tax=Austropuccinia psidii MF-1 TaxID=1389203 RepID=A0A9Q3K0U4_9BASI|nr:hypothetical protein [Austropuccinia psidii MF-1]
MAVQHSPPANNTRSQRNPAVLTPTARVPLDRTTSVHQLSANMDRGPPMERAAPSRRSRVSLAYWVDTLACLKASEASNLAHSNQPLVSQAEPNFLKMMEQMTHFMGQLTQEVSARDNSKSPAFKTP